MCICWYHFEICINTNTGNWSFVIHINCVMCIAIYQKYIKVFPMIPTTNVFCIFVWIIHQLEKLYCIWCKNSSAFLTLFFLYHCNFYIRINTQKKFQLINEIPFSFPFENCAISFMDCTPEMECQKAQHICYFLIVVSSFLFFLL